MEQTNNSEICKEIEDLDTIDKCYMNVGIALNDPSFCENIRNNTGSNYDVSCYYRIAIKTNNIELCEFIAGLEKDHKFAYNRCIGELAKKS